MPPLIPCLVTSTPEHAPQPELEKCETNRLLHSKTLIVMKYPLASIILCQTHST